jgi:hypothetical protein
LKKKITIPAFLGKVIGATSAGKDFVLHKVMDDLIFPWYEAKTGKHSSDRIMRRQIAEQVERSLSRTLWIPKKHSNDLDEMGLDENFNTPPRFIVGNVFAKSRMAGHYSLMVSLYQKGLPDNTHTVDLETFMRDMVPYEEINFSDYNA